MVFMEDVIWPGHVDWETLNQKMADLALDHETSGF